MIKTEKELIESWINEIRGRIIWDQASLKSIEIQIREREIKTPADEFSYQKVKNDLLNNIEINTRMLGILTDMLIVKRNGTIKPKSN